MDQPRCTFFSRRNQRSIFQTCSNKRMNISRKNPFYGFWHKFKFKLLPSLLTCRWPCSCRCEWRFWSLMRCEQNPGSVYTSRANPGRMMLLKPCLTARTFAPFSMVQNLSCFKVSSSSWRLRQVLAQFIQVFPERINILPWKLLQRGFSPSPLLACLLPPKFTKSISSTMEKERGMAFTSV